MVQPLRLNFIIIKEYVRMSENLGKLQLTACLFSIISNESANEIMVLVPQNL